MLDIRREAPRVRLPIMLYQNSYVRLVGQCCRVGEGYGSSGHGHCPLRASNRMRSRCAYLAAVNDVCAVRAEFLKIYYLIHRFPVLWYPPCAYRGDGCVHRVGLGEALVR